MLRMSPIITSENDERSIRVRLSLPGGACAEFPVTCSSAASLTREPRVASETRANARVSPREGPRRGLNVCPATPDLIPAIDAGAGFGDEVEFINRAFAILDFAHARALN